MTSNKHDRSLVAALDEGGRSAEGSQGPWALRAGLRALTALSPRWAARAVHRLWFMPPRRTPSTRARAALASAARVPVQVEGRTVVTWRAGSGPPIVLMHGWGGHAGQLGAFLAPLVEAGFQVVAFDAPGHGESAPGAMGFRQASFFEFAAALLAIAEQVGPLAGIVAHSGGAAAVGVALRRGLRVGRVVLVAPLARPQRYLKRFSTFLSLDAEVLSIFRAEAERRLGFTWSELELTAPGITSLAPDALVVHDEGDAEVDFEEGAAVAQSWQARLVRTSGLGHYKLLREPSVVAQAVAFLRAPAGPEKRNEATA